MKYSEMFVVKPGSKVELDRIDASFKGEHESHQHALPEIERYCEQLSELQYLLYAEDKRSLLICLQAMDAGGKGGTVNHVLGAMNPRPAAAPHRRPGSSSRPTTSGSATTRCRRSSPRPWPASP